MQTPLSVLLERIVIAEFPDQILTFQAVGPAIVSAEPETHKTPLDPFLSGTAEFGKEDFKVALECISLAIATCRLIFDLKGKRPHLPELKHSWHKHLVEQGLDPAVASRVVDRFGTDLAECGFK
jgi:hypothetical protein